MEDWGVGGCRCNWVKTHIVNQVDYLHFSLLIQSALMPIET